MVDGPMNLVSSRTIGTVVPPRCVAAFARGIAFGWGIGLFTLVSAGPVAGAEPNEVVLRGHEGAAFAAQFTPDGERMVTAATDGTALLWDAATGQELRRFSGHTGPVTGVAVSGDGRTLVTASQDNTVRVWDLPLRRPILARSAHGTATALALTADGRTLLTGGLDPIARLWDTQRLRDAAATVGGAAPPAGGDGGPLTLGDALGPARALAWRADGAQYLLADDAGRIVLGSPFLDVPLGTIGVHGGGVAATAFVPGNPQQILSAGLDGTLRLWQGPPAVERSLTVAAGIRDLLPLPGQPVAAVAREDGGIQVIDIATMQPVRDLPPGVAAHALAATADGSTLVIGDEAGAVRWVNTADGADRGSLGGHAGGVLDVAATADGAMVFTAGADGTVRQWARPAVGSPLDGHAQGVKLAVAAADGQWFATTGDDRTLRIWSGAGQPLRTVGTHEQPLACVAISADAQGLAAGDAAGAVSLWNPQSGAAQGALLPHLGSVWAIAHQRDGRALWTAGADGTIKRTKLPLPAARTFAGHGQAVRAIVTTADGRGAFSAGLDGVVRQWDIPSGQATRTFGEGAPAGAVTALAIAADDSLIAAVSETGSVRAWRVADGAVAFVANLPGVPQRDVTILPPVDGLSRLVTLGDDQRLRLWTLAATPVADGKDVVPVAELPLPEAGTDRLALAADGSWLATCGAGRIVRRFRVDAAGVTPIEGGFTAGAARITDIACSRDGAWFAASGEDGKVSLWDARTIVAAPADHPPVRALLARGAVRSVAFDAAKPAAIVTTAADDGAVVNWNLATGRQVERFAATAGIVTAAIGPGAVLAAGADPAIRVWTPAVDLVIEVTPGLEPGGAVALVALPGERGIAALVAGERALRRWDRDGQPLPAVLGADAALAHLATSPDGLHAVAATAAGQAWMWNLSTDAITGPISLGAGVTTLALTIPATAEALPQILVADSLPRLRAIDPTSGMVVEAMALPFPALVPLSTGAAGPGPGGTGALGRNWVAFGAQPQGVLKARCWVRTLVVAPAAITALALSPDGAKLYGAGEDGRVVAVRTADGVTEPGFDAGPVPIRELAWVPQPPSIAAASADGAVRIWPIGAVAEPRILRDTVPLVSLAVSADSSKLATLSEAGIVQHWSLATDTPLQTFPGHAAGRGRVRWLADNLSVVSGSTDRAVRQVKGSALRSLRIGAGPITALASVGSQVVVTSADGSVQVADLSGNNPPRRITEGLALPVVLAARPDGQRLAVGDGTGGIGIWESNGWQRLERVTLRSAPAALGWSGDGRKLVAATAPIAAGGPTLEVFGPPRAPATVSPGKEFVPHQSIETGVAIRALAVDAEGRGTWCLHDDGVLREWGLAALDALRRFDAGSPVLAVAISRDGGTVVSGGNDQSVRIWDPATGQQRAQMTGHAGPVLALALTPDDAMIVSASGDLTLRLWDVSGGRALKQLAATDEAVYSLSVHPTGRTVAAGGADRSIHLFDILGGGIERSLRGHTDFVHAVAFNRQGTRLLSYGYAGLLKIWNPADGTLLHDTVVGRIGNHACWGAAGGADTGGVPGAVDDRIGVACGDGTVRIVVVPLSAR